MNKELKFLLQEHYELEDLAREYNYDDFDWSSFTPRYEKYKALKQKLSDELDKIQSPITVLTKGNAE